MANSITEKLLRLQAILMLKDMAFKEKICVMAQAGFEPKEIADILQVTASSVRGRLSELKRDSGSKRKKALGKQKSNQK